MEEAYGLVPVSCMLLVNWTSSETKPWSSFLVERIVSWSSVRFGRSKLLDFLSNFAVNGAKGLIFGKSLECRFID